MSETVQNPLACVAGAIPADERQSHSTLTEELFRTAVRRDRLADGYGFQFPADRFPEVTAFVRNERKCCPFLRFRIDLSPTAGMLLLRLTGPPGTAGFLEAELRL